MIVRSGITMILRLVRCRPLMAAAAGDPEVGLDERTLHDYEVKLAGEVHADADPRRRIPARV